MTVCRFFTQGNCRYGDHCKFEHPGRNAPVSSRNPFAPLQNSPSHTQGGNIRGSSSNQDPSSNTLKLDKSSIIIDLSKDLPQYILSAYGPGRDCPLQLFGGLPREQSFEELRLRHYELEAQVGLSQAIQEAQTLFSNADQQIRAALQDVDGAIKYIVDGNNQHPNRIDICNSRGAGLTPNETPTSTQQSNFSQAPTAPQELAQNSAPSAFGQPSAPTSTFGQPSASNFTQPSAFGQSAALERPTTSFGQPSTLGKPSVSASAFGQPAAAAVLSPFGPPSQASAPTAPRSTPFGQPSAPPQAGVFGRPSAPISTNAFGQSAPTAPVQTSAVPRNPFGNPTATSIPGVFGQPSNAASDPFGQPRCGNPQVPTGQPAAPATSVSIANVAAARRPNAQIPTVAQTLKNDQGKIQSWNGKSVSYIDGEPCFKGNDGSWHKIWFPDGPPPFLKTTDLPDEVYDEATKENYMFLKQHGTFRDGMMPLLPPKREWCNWNL